MIILVTVAYVETSFLKLKLLESYLWSTMSQKKLKCLKMIFILNNLLESNDYQEFVNKFDSKDDESQTIYVTVYD